MESWKIRLRTSFGYAGAELTTESGSTDGESVSFNLDESWRRFGRVRRYSRLARGAAVDAIACPAAGRVETSETKRFGGRQV